MAFVAADDDVPARPAGPEQQSYRFGEDHAGGDGHAALTSRGRDFSHGR
jgi:hypothetical protein